jgi:hypothetical protein
MSNKEVFIRWKYGTLGHKHYSLSHDGIQPSMVELCRVLQENTSGEY